MEDKRLVIEVGGIGYQIGISQRDAMSMPLPGMEVMIHTYLSVREDDVSLFGFLSEQDLRMYRLLIGVSGIGPKVGLSILSVLSASQIAAAVVSDDAKTIGTAPGVGPKMAKKVIIELKDRVGSFETDTPAPQPEPTPVENEAFESAKAEAVNILTALGYTKPEAQRAVEKAKLTEDMDTDQILSAALAENR